MRKADNSANTMKWNGESGMKIIKRNGAEESFDTLKIVNAVQKACNATENAYLAPEQLTDIL